MAKKNKNKNSPIKKIIPENVKVDGTANLTFASMAKALEFVTRNAKAQGKEHIYNIAQQSDSEKVNVTVNKKTAAVVSAKTNIVAPNVVLEGGGDAKIEIMKIDSPNFKGEVAKVTPKDAKAADVVIDAKCADGQQLVADKSRGIVGCKEKI